MEFHKGKLRQKSESESGIRGGEIEGSFDLLPEVGRGFRFVGEPLNPQADMRLVWTSPVVGILSNEGGKMMFKTENTTYELEYTLT